MVSSYKLNALWLIFWIFFNNVDLYNMMCSCARAWVQHSKRRHLTRPNIGNCYCVNQASVYSVYNKYKYTACSIHQINLWCATFILVWTMLSEMKWGSTWGLFNAYRPQTMAHFLESMRLHHYTYCLCTIVNRSTVCGRPIWLSSFVRVQRSCGGSLLEHIKSGFHRNLTSKIKSVFECARVRA